MPDPYAYPGTNVLVNIPGYTDPELWKAAERTVVQANAAFLLEHPLDGDFDLAHLQAIHAYLVQDFYTWGGQLRVSDTGPGGTGLAHCRPEFIPAEADRIFTTLSDDLGFLRERDADSFSTGLAWVWGETTVLHPFRDVNTRSQFIFFNQLARDAGWVIDWSQIDAYVFGYARTVAISTDERGIDALIRPALQPVAVVEEQEDRWERLRVSEETFFAPRHPRTREQLDDELRHAISRRSRLRPADRARQQEPPPSAPGSERDLGPSL